MYVTILEQHSLTILFFSAPLVRLSYFMNMIIVHDGHGRLFMFWLYTTRLTKTLNIYKIEVLEDLYPETINKEQG